jgi:rhamnosyl/mannosyltransferase
MRIHIINTFYPPWRGGAETYNRNLAENLSKMGHTVKVTVASPPLSPGEQFHDKVAVTRLRSVGMFYGVPIMPALFYRIMKIESDIIHVNFPNPYNALMGALVSRIKNIPSLLTWHNDLPPVTKFAGALVRIHDDFATHFYLDQYDSIITTSHVYADGSKILKRYSGKIRVIVNGVDCDRFRPDISGEDIRKRLNLGNCKIVLFVGALTKWHRYKGLDNLIRAVGLIDRNDAKLLVVGGGDLKSEYVDLAKRSGVGDRIVFAGEVPDELLPKYYAVSDMLVLPSIDRSEGFGLTILEANASGVPAIASKVGGIPGILIDGENGILVRPNDPVSLANAIFKMIENDELRRKMGRTGRAMALDHDWKKVAAETERLYLDLIIDTPLPKAVGF